MTTKKKVLALVLVVGVFLLQGLFINSCLATAAKGKITIGITQIVEHPALDAAREGFIKALADNGYVDGKNVELEVRSAQGDLSIANMIAEEFTRKKKDLILAIATPTAQAALNATKTIPIVITAVTDPVSAGLVVSLKSSKNNVTGTTDMTPIESQISLLKDFLPKAKTIGILYNASEANSISQVKIVRESCKKRGLKLVEATVTNIQEVQIAVEQLCKKVEALYIPTDNLVASAMPVVSASALKAGIPVIGSESSQVESGALATLGIDYKKLGYATGLMAVKVLKGAKPASLPIESLTDLTLVINEKTAAKLKITIPEKLKSKAVFIKGGE